VSSGAVLLGVGVARDIVRGVEAEFHATVGLDLGYRADGHSDAGDKRHPGEEADLVLVVLEWQAGVANRAAGMDKTTREGERPREP
jgi:hypothetical protein